MHHRELTAREETQPCREGLPSIAHALVNTAFHNATGGSAAQDADSGALVAVLVAATAVRGLASL